MPWMRLIGMHFAFARQQMERRELQI